VARPHHRGQVGRRIAGAVLGAAHGTQHARDLAHAVDLEAVEPGGRHDRVEHEPRDAIGMGDGVTLGDEGAVRSAVERELVGAERHAQRLEIGHRVGRRVEAPSLAQLARAGLHCPARRHGQVRRPHRPLQRRAAQRVSAGPALVEHHEAVTAQHRAHARAHA
jgi:hypothetical protein